MFYNVGNVYTGQAAPQSSLMQKAQSSQASTLRGQIDPFMTMVPDADQTFGQYVRELLATSKGFGGPFAGGQGSQQQETPQTKIVDGLFGKYLPESGSDYQGSTGTPVSSQIGVGQMTDAINAQALQGAGMLGLGMLGVPGLTNKGLEGLFNASQAPDAFMSAINQAPDPLGAWAMAQGHVPSPAPGFNPWDSTSGYDSSGAYGGASVNDMGAGGYADMAMGGADAYGGYSDSGSGGGGGDYSGGFSGDVSNGW